MRRRVYREEYGPVEVAAGCHRGKVGYYDDDDYDDEGKQKAIVYFGTPFDGPYVMLPLCWLRHTDVTHLPLDHWIRQNPEVAYQMGVMR